MTICNKCKKEKSINEGEEIFGIWWCFDCENKQWQKIEKNVKHKKPLISEL